MTDEVNELQASGKQKRMFFALCGQLGWDQEMAKEKAKERFKLDSFANISSEQLSRIIDKMSAKANEKTKLAIVALLDMADTFPYFMDNSTNREMPMHEFLTEQLLKYFYIKEKNT